MQILVSKRIWLRVCECSAKIQVPLYEFPLHRNSLLLPKQSGLMPKNVVFDLIDLDFQKFGRVRKSGVAMSNRTVPRRGLNRPRDSARVDCCMSAPLYQRSELLKKSYVSDVFLFFKQ